MITNHDKPNWDQCCSCCPTLEKRNKELMTLNKKQLNKYKMVMDILKEHQLKLPKDFDDKLKQRIKEIDQDGNNRHNS